MSKERLVELIHQVAKDVTKIPTDNFIEYLADYLLANGVIVPPCKVGDVVYIKALKERLPFVVTQISIKKSGTYYEADRIRNKKGNLLYFHDITSVVFDDTDFGKTVFLTRSQAEEALKNREQKEI
jgi:hypothetical protein